MLCLFGDFSISHPCTIFDYRLNYCDGRPMSATGAERDDPRAALMPSCLARDDVARAGFFRRSPSAASDVQYLKICAHSRCDLCNRCRLPRQNTEESRGESDEIMASVFIRKKEHTAFQLKSVACAPRVIGRYFFPPRRSAAPLLRYAAEYHKQP